MAERAEPVVSLRAGVPLGLAANAAALTEIVDRSLVTIALPDDGVRERLAAAFGVALPATGASVLTEAGERLMGLQHDRLYVLFDAARANGADDALVTGDQPERALLEGLAARGLALAGAANATDTTASVTDAATAAGTGADSGGDAASGAGPPVLYSSDQSDAWVMLRLDGAASRRVLERLCPLDLHPDVFPIDAVARSVIEHLGVVVLREDEDAFVLLSPRSSAHDFLHEIETTLDTLRGAP